MHIIVVKKSLLKKVIIGISILILAIILFMVFNKNSKSTMLGENNNLPIYSVDTENKNVAITFDTSWGDDNTTKILDVLDKEKVKATFFVIGRWADEFPDKTKDIAKRGHEIGNHSDTHMDFTKISKNQIINEVAAADAKIEAITGTRPILFRFPEGTYNDSSVALVEQTDHKCIQWNVDSIDWKNDGEDIEFNRVMKKVKPGSILLFHNSGKYTPKTLTRIIDKLKSEGYSFVKVSDLVYKDNYSIDNEGKQIKK
ncbi:polysaccharide deacetylase family sporulation protein PdaB [Clostridium arbusti]|uniref:polysaccharide deacetylase family sporulation protein PdaB n=1 Tax=Clostridium arbusti TaxID=1137848 RepID=UPI0002886F0C|nr:polysaccharide deacetylase family sporulation protein PdaB [Clostridium arbusti]